MHVLRNGCRFRSPSLTRTFLILENADDFDGLGGSHSLRGRGAA